jgi:hypothetical protein
MNPISKVENGLINPDDRIFEILANDPPTWWMIAKKDPELYIEIRKYNEIMIYYNGGRAAGIKYSKRKKCLEVTAHPKYLGHKDNTDLTYYKDNDKHTPIYQPCEDWLENKLEELKKNIRIFYSGDEVGEDTSEKFIQSKLIIRGRKKYLDSEFAHRFRDGERNTIRIDLVKIEDGKIIFEELKRIKDNRLMTKDAHPEILTQMQEYHDFLAVNYRALEDYYKKLYRIKEKLGLLVPSVDEVEALVVDKEPQLIIANNYNIITSDRADRIKEIEKILKSKNIVFSFFNETHPSSH